MAKISARAPPSWTPHPPLESSAYQTCLQNPSSFLMIGIVLVGPCVVPSWDRKSSVDGWRLATSSIATEQHVLLIFLRTLRPLS